MIIDHVARSGKSESSTALSGIAATLLRRRGTLHSSFKIPIRLFGKEICFISREDSLGWYVIRLNLLIVDEVTMGNKFIYECLD